MIARAHTFTVDGLHVERVTVEVELRRGLPAFVVVGLADAPVREARERVRAAIRNCGFDLPTGRITASLAPADVPKAGPGLDLALACAILAAGRQASPTRLATHGLFGELGLDGEVRGCHGTLAAAQAAFDSGLQAIVVARSQARDATLVEGLRVAPVRDLRRAVEVLGGGAPDPPLARDASRLRRRPSRNSHAVPAHLDLRDVRGQYHGVHAIVLAAAGGHNLLLSGAPGTGKTMLAHRIVSVLPPLSRREAVEVARIHGLTSDGDGGLVVERPFRAPHHSITAAGLLGGARHGRLGEVVLAHRGVLFLDELSEFARPVLEALRQPVEEGRLAIVRARRSQVYPARFTLLAATNPCPCGYAGETDRCRCSEAQLRRHRLRLSGPLLDRMDMLVHLRRDGVGAPGAAPLTSSGRERERVLSARERQAARLAHEGLVLNAEMDARLLRRHARLDERGERMLERAHAQGLLSARGQHRVLRVARTIADLDGSARVRSRDMGAALALRPEVALNDTRVA
jgi:magnesium chelatase family protein